MTKEEKIENIKAALNIEYKLWGFGKDLLNIKVLNEIDMDDSEYRSEEESIIFKESYFDNASLLELVSQAFHEARHFYQHVQINFRDKLSDNDLLLEDPNLVKQWKDEFKNYVRPSGDISCDYKFLDQDIELDAMTFSYYLTLKLFKIETYIPEYIKERFNKRLDKFNRLYN